MHGKEFMARTVNKERSRQLQRLITLIGDEREPFIETGRKFDKVFVDGDVRYFVARQDIGVDVKAGDIYGAKSKLAPNFRWYFGNLHNVEKWNWSGKHGRNETDSSVVAAKSYGTYVHYIRVK
jgi:hypothetical protein